jgi:hypothetical protein
MVQLEEFSGRSLSKPFEVPAPAPPAPLTVNSDTTFSLGAAKEEKTRRRGSGSKVRHGQEEGCI